MKFLLLLISALAALPAGAEQVPSMPAPPKAPMNVPPSAADAARLGTLPDGIGVAVGKPAPAFELPDIQGKKVTLASLGPKTLVIFYRGGWCPFCNGQLRELTERAPDFEKLGIKLVAISVDQPDKAATTAAAWTIPFAVLSDSDLTTHTAWNVVWDTSGKEFEMLKGFGLDLEAWSGQKHHKIAIPAVFLVEGGVVRWAHADTQYKIRPSAEQLLAVLKAL